MPIFSYDPNETQVGETVRFGPVGITNLGDIFGTKKNGAASSPTSPYGVPREVAPQFQKYQFSQDSLNYPTAYRNLGENLAQKQYQTMINQGVMSGNPYGGYQKAASARNNARLDYLAKSGQMSMGVDQAQQGALKDYQDLMLKSYGINVEQRGQDLHALKPEGGGGGGGGGFTMGGKNTPRSGDALNGPYGGYVGMGGVMNPSYTGISPNFQNYLNQQRSSTGWSF